KRPDALRPLRRHHPGPLPDLRPGADRRRPRAGPGDHRLRAAAALLRTLRGGVPVGAPAASRPGAIGPTGKPPAPPAAGDPPVALAPDRAAAVPRGRRPRPGGPGAGAVAVALRGGAPGEPDAAL